MASLKQIYRGSVFFKSFIATVLIMLIPVLLSAAFSIFTATNSIFKDVTRSNRYLIGEKKFKFEQYIGHLDNTAAQISRDSLFLENFVNSSISRKPDISMQNLIRKLSAFIESDETVYSIAIFSDNTDYILSDTRYGKKDFFDADLLDRTDRDIQFLPLRRIEETECLTYIRRYRTLESNESVYIAFYFLPEVVRNKDIKEQTGSSYDIQILTMEDRLVQLFPDDFPGGIDGPDWGKELSEEDSKFDIGRESFIFSLQESESLKLIFLMINPYSDFSSTANIVKNNILISLIAILALALVAAYVFSIYIYSPLKNILDKSRSAFDFDESIEKNEYELLDQMLSKTFREKEEMREKYDFALPIIRRNSISEIVSTQPFNEERFDRIITLLNKDFRFSRYYVLVMDLENCLFTEKIRSTIETYLLDSGLDCEYLISRLFADRIVAVFNSDEKPDSLILFADRLREYMKSMEITSTFSLSGEFSSREEIPAVLKKVVSNLELKFYKGIDRIYTETDLSFSRDQGKSVESRDMEAVIQGALARNREQSLNELKVYTEDLKGKNTDIAYARYLFNHMALKLLDEANALLPDQYRPDYDTGEILHKIGKAKTIDAIRSYIDEIIISIIDCLSTFKRNQYDIITGRINDYIKENYSRDISLDEIASNIFLSTGYMCQVYKSETGKTVHDYLTSIRIDKAKELLTGNHPPKVKEISERTGFNNVQTFLRAFKKSTSMTPGQYKSLKKD